MSAAETPVQSPTGWAARSSCSPWAASSSMPGSCLETKGHSLEALERIFQERCSS